MNRRWQDRITIHPEIHHGDPCIKGTRIPVAMVVGSLADGLTFDLGAVSWPLAWACPPLAPITTFPLILPPRNPSPYAYPGM